MVALCVQQQSSTVARQLARKHEFIVWWCTSVEMQSAFERLARMRELSPAEYLSAARHLSRLRHGWQEVSPTQSLRFEAESLLARFPLKAADALQLAAAMTWAGSFPKGRIFVASDGQLLDAARQLGLQVIPV
jgi:predicted nucleic acid-binding protein